jgi:aminodeoxyfutalosine deaminase
MSLESYLRAVPKAELHVHLEGSIQPATILELARRNGRPLPYDTVTGLEQWFQFRDFYHFIEVYVAITECIRTVEDYELVVVEFAAELARQNVRYVEATFSPSTHHARGRPHEVYFTGISRGRQRALTEHGVEIQWVFDIVRNPAVMDLGRAARFVRAEYTAEVAIEGMRDGVVALGLGGAEAGHPPDLFTRWFEMARDAGLRRTPHAGEMAGPQSIWGAIRGLHAERIGHGVRAIEDPDLVAYLREHRLPVELCPVSNIRLGIYPSLGEHPLRRLFDAGVPITVNSDDPPLFNTTLTDQVLALAVPFDLNVDQIDEVVLNGVRHSFLPPARKSALEAEFRVEMARLRGEHEVGAS